MWHKAISKRRRKLSKKIKILISMLVAAALLVVGGTTIAMAQEEESVATSQAELKSPLLARVAGILEIPQEELIEAFKQARQEVKQEALDEAAESENITRERIRERIAEKQQKWLEKADKAFLKLLDKAVERGRIDGDEAEEIKEWWEDRPEAVGRLFLHVSPAVRGRQMIAVPKGWRGKLAPQSAE